MSLVAPSLLAADFSNLQRELASIDTADWLHFDVMDGHFVPNISMGPDLLRAVMDHTRLFADVHLMIEQPDRYVKAFADAGAQCITVHVEACTHLHRTVGAIRELGVKAGVALNPATPVDTITHVIDEVDLVLVMTVNPGFGGQRFIPSMIEKIKQVKELVSNTGKDEDIHIQVDGGIDLDTGRACAEAGASILVAGTSVFKADDRGKMIRSLQSF